MDKKDMVNVIHIHLKWGKEPSDPSQQWKQSKSCKAHGGSGDGSDPPSSIHICEICSKKIENHLQLRK